MTKPAKALPSARGRAHGRPMWPGPWDGVQHTFTQNGALSRVCDGTGRCDSVVVRPMAELSDVAQWKVNSHSVPGTVSFY